MARQFCGVAQPRVSEMELNRLRRLAAAALEDEDEDIDDEDDDWDDDEDDEEEDEDDIDDELDEDVDDGTDFEDEDE